MADLLVIEDDPSVLLLLTYALRGAGHEVEALDRGDDALVRLEGPAPDAVLVDVMLPGGISGLDLLQRMRERANWAAVPAVVLSALGSRRDQRAGMLAGASAYLVKPYDPEQLVEVLEEQLTAARAHDDRVSSLELELTPETTPDVAR